MSIDFSKYKTVDEIENDIKTVAIQGATNVAIATFEGIKLFIDSYDSTESTELFIADVERVAIQLSQARPNEPLARNGVRFLMYMLRVQNNDLQSPAAVKEKVYALVEEYLQFIEDSKQRVIESSEQLLDSNINEVLTHCHSSTVENVIIAQSKRVQGFKAVCTETRPLLQGRITAKALVDGGVDTTLIVDSSAESFIVGRGSHEIDMVFIGCDEITMQGDAINKIGSWGVALASYYASKPLYVVGSILKTEVSTAYKPVEIEMRDAHEVWDEAPDGLKMVNPSFELINHQFITGFITELGVIKPEDIERTVQKQYKWLF